MFRLDYLSCILTVTSTILVGRRCWEGWALAAVNGVLVCIKRVLHRDERDQPARVAQVESILSESGHTSIPLTGCLNREFTPR